MNDVVSFVTMKWVEESAQASPIESTPVAALGCTLLLGILLLLWHASGLAMVLAQSAAFGSILGLLNANARPFMVRWATCSIVWAIGFFVVYALVA